MPERHDLYLERVWRIQQLAFDSGEDAALAEARALVNEMGEDGEALFGPSLDGPMAAWQAEILLALSDAMMPRNWEWRGMPLPNLVHAELGQAEELSWSPAPDCRWPKLKRLTLVAATAALAEWCARQSWPELTHLSLRKTTSPALGGAGWLRRLEKLQAIDSPMNLVFADWGLPSLQSLQLENCSMDDAAVARIPSSLSELDLSRNPVAIEAVQPVLGPHLVRLGLRGITIYDAGFFAALPEGLRALEVTVASPQLLSGLARLTDFACVMSKLDAGVLPFLTSLLGPELRSLSLMGNPLGDQAMEPLEALLSARPSLRELDLRGTRMSQLAQLQARHPEVKISGA